MTTLFVDVIVPLSVPNLYTYRVPYEWNDSIAVGKRVIIQFGKSKLYTAIIRQIKDVPPSSYAAKYIDNILDDQPIVTEKQLRFWEWLSNYYMCNIGEVMNAALPSGLKLSSETRIILNPDFDKNYQQLSDKEYLIVEALEVKQVISITDVCNILDQKTVYPLIKSLIEKSVLIIEEEIIERYKPKKEVFVRLNIQANEEEKLKELFDVLEKKAPKQLDLLLKFIQLSKRYSANPEEVKRSLLVKTLEGADSGLAALIKKNVFELYEKEQGRLSQFNGKQNPVNQLNEIQEKAFIEIKKQFETKNVTLLHGVTSSGKTEIYIKLIEECLNNKQQVLYLLPEIALTTQIINRLRKFFGNQVGVYHSKYNENERVEIWNSVLSQFGQNNFKVILGARSALFLPFENLGLIIVDEEHENTFKQYDPSPRYHARDSAIILAGIHGAKTLLGSATPSVESYYNAASGKFGLVELNKRFGGIQMPEILVADVKEATRKKLMKSHFSPMLLDEIQEVLNNKQQIILFQNRRGYAPLLNCQKCNWTPQCTNCDVSLTYHKHINLLRCHYCGFNQKTPKVCEACGSPEIKMKGFGTEKIEDELGIFFPSARVKRMDLDSTRSKNAYYNIISDFEEGNVDILVGTQMVTKGLDFDNVALVGILNADNMLQFPDFRAYERSYQLMAQVSGRAGRKNKRGKVIIQTYNPNHSIIKDVIMNNFTSMYTNELLDRKNFHYPPFYRLIEIALKHSDLNVLNEGAKCLVKNLKSHFGKRILGPESPAVARVRNLYIKNILIKVEKEASTAQVKQIINDELINFTKSNEYKSIRISIDVDPI